MGENGQKSRDLISQKSEKKRINFYALYILALFTLYHNEKFNTWLEFDCGF